jgi:heat shock protein HslJ
MKKLLPLFALVALVIASCKSTDTASSTTLLTSGNWQLESINGKKADAAEFKNGLPTASFNIDHKIAGKSGCNQYGGSYNLNEEGGINISEVFSTKMFCDGVTGEQKYLDALAKVNLAKVDKDKLVLLKDVDEVLVFKHAE